MGNVRFVIRSKGMVERVCNLVTHSRAPALTVKLHYLTAGGVMKNCACSKLDLSFGF